MLSSSGTIVEWGECMADCPKEDVTAVCVMEPGDNAIKKLKNMNLYFINLKAHAQTHKKVS